ncbi:hypothetical protein [Mesorhizobium erdmanii]|uniref:hypothetical protein n=1 Tax=Mesorhizobium erdmanii TaxID=1777866 RepID=UPI0012B67B20|nr:hypothetical protein [Mesorhizobium erdmanii]
MTISSEEEHDRAAEGSESAPISTASGYSKAAGLASLALTNQFQEKCEAVFPEKAHSAFPWDCIKTTSYGSSPFL